MCAYKFQILSKYVTSPLDCHHGTPGCPVTHFENAWYRGLNNTTLEAHFTFKAKLRVHYFPVQQESKEKPFLAKEPQIRLMTYSKMFRWIHYGTGVRLHEPKWEIHSTLFMRQD